MTPAKDFRHAIRSFNFIFALDNYDSAGRFDEYMGDYYNGEADAAEYLQELFRAVDRHDGWHLLYTGKNPDFTKLCIGVQRTSRPNSGLLITKDTPVEIWDAVFAKWAEGIPCPCLYNAKEYIKSLQYYGPEIAEAAENLLSFGGCTETMFQGCSNIGSTEAGINLLKILTCSTADDFYENIKKEIELTIKEIRINCEFAAEFRPHLIRTLFVDDCIERELEYHNGGAIYNGSIFNVAGLTNAANALAAMQGNSEKFGNDQDIADGIARDLAAYTFGLIRQYRSRLDGITLPAIIILSHFTALGRTIDVTADGRNAGDPVVDSAGAVPGTDIYGPTALLKSVAKLPGSAAAGTPVLNIRLQKNILQNSGSELRSLFMSFFQMGGMQLQATVADQETLQAAHENPADYPDLMIRIGGFSTYFASLDKNLREDILKRTEHAL